MGATAVLERGNRGGSNPAAADTGGPKAVETDSGMLLPIADAALREVLRNLQLSPDLVDKSAAAVYAYIRDPVEHPVDKELTRLCTSEYTRGALHALSWYLLAVSKPERKRSIANEASVEKSATTTSGEAGSSSTRPPPILLKSGGRTGGGGRERFSSDTLAESFSEKVSNLFNRLRPARSTGRTAVCPTETAEAENNLTQQKQNPPLASSSACLPPLDIRVGTTPRTTIKTTTGTRLLAGLGLGSPSGRGVREPATPRRAPVRTGHWKLGHEIGRGSFGSVHIGLNEDSGDLIAVKLLSLKSANQAEEFYTEIELMRQLRHPNIVCYLGAEVNDSEKTISIFQEWVPGSVTTLLVNFGPFSDRRIADYTMQILQGLVYLHSERVIHRDIKGGNILIDDRGVVKLCDFGASKLLDAESFTGMGDHTRVGSPLFMAPEVLLLKDYGPQVDIWSLGGAVLEMATGQPPWHTLNLRTPVALMNWIKRTEGPPPLPDGLSQQLRRFLLRCFERDPNKRATAKELLSDPFVARRWERELLPKGSASDADSVVSDIDNLSRTAAIARIRRASQSSPPNSNGSMRSPPSLSTSDGDMDTQTAGGAGGSGQAQMDLAQQVVAKLEDASTGGDGDTLPKRPVSLHSALAPRLRLQTAGLEPPASSSGPRVVTPPPARRMSMGRNSPGTPNPFGGRRRSLDTSPDGARSQSSRGASDISGNGASDVSGKEDGHPNEGGRSGKEGVTSEGAATDETAPVLTAAVDAAASAAAAASAGRDVNDLVATNHGSNESHAGNLSSDRSNNGVTSEGDENMRGEDPAASAAGPVSKYMSPKVEAERAVPADVAVDVGAPIKKMRSGRGERPSRRSCDAEAAAWRNNE